MVSISKLNARGSGFECCVSIFIFYIFEQFCPKARNAKPLVAERETIF